MDGTRACSFFVVGALLLLVRCNLAKHHTAHTTTMFIDDPIFIYWL